MNSIPLNKRVSSGIRDGRKSHPLKRTYENMLYRCYSDKCPTYSHYGGRGIKVCNRWLGTNGFWNFVADMGEKNDNRLTLDRIDNNKGYSKSNCRWADQTTQIRNRRVSLGNKYSGVTLYSRTDKWQLRIKVNNKYRHIGYFDTAEEANIYKSYYNKKLAD